MKIQIDYLKNHPQHVKTLAEWSFNTWGHYNPGASVEKSHSKLLEHLHSDTLPLTFVAIKDNNPIGMCSLRINDGIRTDLFPWLGSLYVEPAMRSHGVGEQLIKKIKLKAKAMGYARLYLFAFDPTLPSWYQKLGWQPIGEDDVNGNHVTVMHIELE